MKRRLLMLPALALLLFAGCQKDNPEEGAGTPQAPTGLSLSPERIDSGSDGGDFPLVVTAPSRPSVSGAPEWLSIKDGVYNPETYRITFTVKVASNRGEPRTATLTINAGSLSKTLEVREEGFVIPKVDKSKIPAAPVNPNATPQARALYSFLLENYGTVTLSGVQSSDSHTNDYVNAVYNATGGHPSLAGYDFIFLQYSPTPPSWSWRRDYTDISEQKEHWNAGGIISYMWHWNVPRSEEVFRSNDTSSGNYGFYTKDTDFDIREALKEDTWQHEFLLQDIDEIAVTLKMLQDEGIPVLFRPLHEAAGNYTRYNPEGGAWFWWGRYGALCCKQLWALLRDRLQNHHGLNNLLWVWTVDAVEGFEEAAKEWYPGDDQVDIAGVDIYAEDTAAKPFQFAFLQNVTGGKKILTVSECGNIPSPEESILAGCPWSWFMVWPTSENNIINISGYSLNTIEYWKSLMSSPYVLTRENMKPIAR